ncbi:Eukaryotic peptide chain release factor GTP-binding subunit, partial [Xylographa opegraphella]|nr:Eukaryotic peptide chain release factor GTP-binding subunit [Xylographa opegraphella]
MSNSSRPQSSASRTSRTHIPSLTSYAFFRPMSSQRLQAQRGTRLGAPGQNLNGGVATREFHGLNSFTTLQPDHQADHELLPPSRGTDITENDHRDRESVN